MPRPHGDGGGRRRVPEEAVFALGHGGLLLILPHCEEACGGQFGQKYLPAGGLRMADDIQHIQLTHMND